MRYRSAVSSLPYLPYLPLFLRLCAVIFVPHHIYQCEAETPSRFSPFAHFSLHADRSSVEPRKEPLLMRDDSARSLAARLLEVEEDVTWKPRRRSPTSRFHALALLVT